MHTQAGVGLKKDVKQEVDADQNPGDDQGHELEALVESESQSASAFHIATSCCIMMVISSRGGRNQSLFKLRSTFAKTL